MIALSFLILVICIPLYFFLDYHCYKFINFIGLFKEADFGFVKFSIVFLF